MLIRIITSLVGLPLLVLLILTGGITLKLAALAVSIIGMFELYRAFETKILPVHLITYFLSIVYYVSLGQENITQAVIIFVVVLPLASLIIYHEKYSIQDCAIAIIGFFYVTFLLSYVYLVRNHIQGEFFVWLIFISAWGCDTGAYFVGKAFGRHKLAPVLSPNKTVEGAIGGVAVASLLGFLFGLAINFLYGNTDAPIICLLLCTVGSIFSQIGDLTASAVKRYTGIKDYGNLFPGHGGVIDRFDSVLFTAPGIYLVLINLPIS